jgi:hypothetical protein
VNLCPITLREANAHVKEFHRHRGTVRGCKFCLGAWDHQNEIIGVVIVGRPVSRHLDNGWTLEVNRLCTDGTKNACSFLYAAAWRATRALGYLKLITYTLPSEGGASLRAAGWRIIGQTKADDWDTPGRPRIDTNPKQKKLRWEASFTGPKTGSKKGPS